MKKVSNIRILCILPTINDAGGIEKVYFSMYQLFSKNIKIDFITHDCNSEYYRKLIKKRGDKLTVFPRMTLFNTKELSKKIEYYFTNNNYDIVHCHALNYSFFYFKYAKKYGIEIRMLHAHISKHADKFINSIRNKLLYMLSKKYTTYRLACSEMTGLSIYKKEEFKTFYNAIDIVKFDLNKNIRKEFRRKYDIDENQVLLGSIGRMVPAKNQLFLLDLIEKIDDKYKLVFIGEGPLINKIKSSIQKKGIDKRVIFIKSNSNINDYYQMLDAILMPSITEGLPMVAIEGQVSGLKMLLSSNITKEVKITDNVEYIDLDDLKKWINEIYKINSKNRESNMKIFMNSYFNVEIQAKKMEKIYTELLINKNSTKG